MAPDEFDCVVDLLGAVDSEMRREASRSWEARVAVAMWEARAEV